MERSDVSTIIESDRWAGALNTAPVKPPSMRVFGIVLLVGFGLLGGLALWSWSDNGATWRLILGTLLVAIGAIVFLWSLVSPATLPPVYRAWMRFGQGIGTIVSTIMFTVLYFVVFTIVGGLMRLFGTDPLDRKIERGAGTYWHKHAPPSTAADYAHLS
jgi:hypothetical protein